MRSWLCTMSKRWRGSAKSAVTAERFAKGMTFEEYLTYAGSPWNLAREAFGSYYPDGGAMGIPRKDNSAVLRERYARTRLADYQVAAIKWLAPLIAAVITIKQLMTGTKHP